MLLGIDHLVIAVPDLDAAVGRFEAELGIDAAGGGTHPRLGTANRLAWFGDSYVELIGIADPDSAARSWLGGPVLRLLEEQGGGFVTFALATDDLKGDVARLWTAQSALVGPIPGERRRNDGEVVRWMLAVPPVVGPTAPPFLIEHDASSPEWRDSDRMARASVHHPIGGRIRLKSLSIDVVDPAKVAQAYASMVGLSFTPIGEGAFGVSVGEQWVLLCQADGSAGPSVEIGLAVLGGGRARGADADLFGCRFVTEPG